VNPLPMVVVCEDGDEYITRFRKLLGAEVVLAPAAGFAQAKRLLDEGAVAVLLDLDFRRTHASDLVDEHGQACASLADGERRHLAASQGILILRALRGSGATAPAILFADLDDGAQADYLLETLAPLAILSSREDLPSIARQIRRLLSG
jgi:aminoglycoside/choline kinase family phosphotransferase